MARFPRLLRRNRKKQDTTPDINTHIEESRMGIFEHLAELQKRMVRIFIGLLIGTTIGFFFAGDALDFMRQPYCQIVEQPVDCQLVTLGPTGGIIAYFRIALMIGTILAIPIITYQIMMFVIPGLTKKERRYILGSLPAITGLFLIGTVFAWTILMPPALGFLEGFQPTLFKPEWTADLYLSFVTSLIFWMGVAFEMPLIFFILALIGIVNTKLLRNNWRFAVVGASIAAALITPTIDPVNMFLVMAPLLGLYVASIILVAIAGRITRA